MGLIRGLQAFVSPRTELRLNPQRVPGGALFSVHAVILQHDALLRNVQAWGEASKAPGVCVQRRLGITT